MHGRFKFFVRGFYRWTQHQAALLREEKRQMTHNRN